MRPRFTPRPSLASLLLGSLLAACGPGPEPVTPAPTAKPSAAPVVTASAAPDAAVHRTETLAADTAMKTASGATFMAPRGWHVTEMGEYLLLQEPEKEMRLVLVESAEPDLQKAIDSAWKLVDPRFARKLEQSVKPPPRDGWDEIQQNEYEMLASDNRGVVAIARRREKRVYVTLIDGAAAALDRRASDMMVVLQSFKAPGMEEVSWKEKAALPLEGERLKALDAFIEESRQKLDVPGFAIAVVQGGKVVLEKGYGVRERGKKDAVSEKTLFMIGSITKSFTTMLMASAVDAGKMEWDTPVQSIWPAFAVGDAEVSKKVLMKHTVCACTGLPRQDLEFLFEWTKVTAQDRIDALKGMKPTTAFGEVFQYSNLMVAAGGYIAAQAFGASRPIEKAFAKQLEARVLAPMGMTATTLDLKAAQKADHASPHGFDYKLQTVVEPLAMEGGVESVGPAGALWSSAHEMALYLQVELGNGKTPGGKQVVSEANLKKRREAMVKIGDKATYGLGQLVERSHGIDMVGHDGGTLGFASDLFFVPEKGFGMVVLTNARAGGALNRAVRRRLLELLFEGKESAAKVIDFAVQSRKDEAAKSAAEIKTAVDAAWAKGIAGTYEHAGLGKVTVSADAKGAVMVDVGEWRSRAGEKADSDGTRKLVLLDPPLAQLEFVVRSKDGKTTLSIDAPQQKYEMVPVGKK